MGLAAWRRRIERSGRALLVRLVGAILGVRRRPVTLARHCRILVVRLDERVGNLVLLTPLLASLRARFPEAEIELLAHYRGAALVGAHPALSRYLAFDKRALSSARGPLWAPLRLRRRRYDLAVDAANPTDPSTTQALLVRLSGARHTVGFAEGAFARLYSAPVDGTAAGPHEIDMRLALLGVIPGTARVRQTSLAPLASKPPFDPGREYGVVNIGARLGEKRLDAASYAALGSSLLEAGVACVFAYGPAESEIACVAAAFLPGAFLAPPTGLTELAVLMQRARLVITCDTGPMHIAVAVGAPTCGLFLSTDPRRYGYAEAPHAAIDTRGRPAGLWLADVAAWVGARLAQHAQDGHGRVGP